MRLNVDIRNDVYDELMKHAERDGRSISDVIRELVNSWNARHRRANWIAKGEQDDGRNEK
jgi:predicted CopG family antitoxin